jgi:hypothetical protein
MLGHTGTMLSTCMNAYWYDVKHALDKNVSQHFNSPNHSLSNLKLIVIEKASMNNLERQLKESAWIRQLQTIEPSGMNSKE